MKCAVKLSKGKVSDLVRSCVAFKWNLPPVRAVFSAWGRGQTDTWSGGLATMSNFNALGAAGRSRAPRATRSRSILSSVCPAARWSYRIWKARASCSAARTASPTRLAPSRAARAPCVGWRVPLSDWLQHANTSRVALRWAGRRAGQRLTLSYFMRILRAMARSSPSRSWEWHTAAKSERKEGRRRAGRFLFAFCFFQKTADKAITCTCRLCSCWRIFTWAAFLSALAEGRNREGRNKISHMPNAISAVLQQSLNCGLLGSHGASKTDW